MRVKPETHQKRRIEYFKKWNASSRAFREMTVKKTFGVLGLAVPAMIVFSNPAFVMAQATPATLHGHITNAAGGTVKTGSVKLSTDKESQEKDRKYQFEFPIDGKGDFNAKGIVPGSYIVVVFVDGKTVDFQTVVLKLGEDRTLDFDMTRADYLKSLSPEERAAIEANKKNNAGVLAENVKIADINKTLIQARADMKAGKADDAVKSLTDLTAARPTEALLWATLGEAQLATADAATKAARAAKTSTSDPALIQKFTDATVSYQKAIDLNAASKKPNPETASTAYLNMGQAYGKSGRIKEASEAYENAVKASPTSAGTAYFNEAATFYNAEKKDEAAAAAEKAIAADPKRADAYYIKGASLIGKATMDAKTNKFVLPAGCLEAYQQYLDLEPNGSHAAEVKDLLVNLGQPVKSSFKAGKK